jgi:hypothetical protein
MTACLLIFGLLMLSIGAILFAAALGPEDLL